MRAMRRLSLLSLLVHALGASGLAAGADGSQPLAGAAFPTYTNRSENPEAWDGIAEALRKAGQPDAIAAIRVRQSAVWSAHVDLMAVSGKPPVQAVVSFDLKRWNILCVTSEVQDCSRYGR